MSTMTPEDLRKTAEPDPEFAKTWEKMKDTFPSLAENIPGTYEPLEISVTHD